MVEMQMKIFKDAESSKVEKTMEIERLHAIGKRIAAAKWKFVDARKLLLAPKKPHLYNSILLTDHAVSLPAELPYYLLGHLHEMHERNLLLTDLEWPPAYHTLLQWIFRQLGRELPEDCRPLDCRVNAKKRWVAAQGYIWTRPLKHGIPLPGALRATKHNGKTLVDARGRIRIPSVYIALDLIMMGYPFRYTSRNRSSRYRVDDIAARNSVHHMFGIDAGESVSL